MRVQEVCLGFLGGVLGGLEKYVFYISHKKEQQLNRLYKNQHDFFLYISFFPLSFLIHLVYI